MRMRVRKSKLWTSARDSMWLRVMAPQRVVTKVCGSTVWLVVGSACPLGMDRLATGVPGGAVGGGGVLGLGLKGGGGEGEDFGFEVEADAGSVGGAGLGVGVGAAGAGAVVVSVEGYEVEELLGVGGDVWVDEALLLGEGYG